LEKRMSVSPGVGGCQSARGELEERARLQAHSLNLHQQHVDILGYPVHHATKAAFLARSSIGEGAYRRSRRVHRRAAVARHVWVPARGVESFDVSSDFEVLTDIAESNFCPDVLPMPCLSESRSLLDSSGNTFVGDTADVDLGEVSHAEVQTECDAGNTHVLSSPEELCGAIEQLAMLALCREVHEAAGRLHCLSPLDGSAGTRKALAIDPPVRVEFSADAVQRCKEALASFEREAAAFAVGCMYESTSLPHLAGCPIQTMSAEDVILNDALHTCHFVESYLEGLKKIETTFAEEMPALAAHLCGFYKVQFVDWVSLKKAIIRRVVESRDSGGGVGFTFDEILRGLADIDS